MIVYQTSISIDAPQAVVWRVLSTVRAWPDWLPTVDEVHALGGSELAVDARFKVSNRT